MTSLQILPLTLIALFLVACAPSISSSPVPLVGPIPQGQEVPITNQTVTGEISARAWTAGTALATVVQYADGTQQLKIEIVENKLASCSKPTSYGWTGLVTIFVPLSLGTHTGMNATVSIHGEGTDVEQYARVKTVRIDRIEGSQVDLGVAAETEKYKVNGVITAQVCASL